VSLCAWLGLCLIFWSCELHACMHVCDDHDLLLSVQGHGKQLGFWRRRGDGMTAVILCVQSGRVETMTGESIPTRLRSRAGTPATNCCRTREWLWSEVEGSSTTNLCREEEKDRLSCHSWPRLTTRVLRTICTRLCTCPPMAISSSSLTRTPFSSTTIETKSSAGTHVSRAALGTTRLPAPPSFFPFQLLIGKPIFWRTHFFLQKQLDLPQKKKFLIISALLIFWSSQ
jgi:hypothetical protein